MERTDYEKFKSDLLAQIQHFAPSGSDYERAVNEVRAIELYALDPADFLTSYKHILYILIDGVRYGNWPWVRGQ